MRKNAEVKIWLGTSIVGSFAFSLFWVKDDGYGYEPPHFDISDIFPSVFYVFGVALLGVGIALIVYGSLRKQWYPKYSRLGTQLRLCLVAMLLICLLGYYPFMMLTALSGLGPTVNRGTGYSYDMHHHNLVSNMFYFFISYATPFTVGIFLDKSVPEK